MLEVYTTWGDNLTLSLAEPVRRVVTSLHGSVSQSYTLCSDFCYSNVLRVYSTDFVVEIMRFDFTPYGKMAKQLALANVTLEEL